MRRPETADAGAFLVVGAIIGNFERTDRTATFADPFSSSLETTAVPSVPDFLTRLERSGVLEPDVFRRIEERARSADAATDSQALAEQLVQQNVLTAFQAAALLSDEPPALVVGNYVLLGKLGQGGMGVVFHAWHRRLKRPVALKTLALTQVRTPDSLARFRQEAEAAGRLQHPNIVATYDADELNGVHYLAMQYVKGMTLERLIEQTGPLATGDAVNLTLQAARGLAFAHSHGVVHRDIKPANLILGVDGILRILDMGLASTDAGGQNDERPGVVPMGSADFLAPEQGRVGSPADPRSDIYSLGCTLYFLLNARPVYGRGPVLQRILAHRQDPIPSLRQHRQEVSPALDAVFHKMVAKAPQDRYASASELIEALERCAPSELQHLIASGIIKRYEADRGLDKNNSPEEPTVPLPLEEASAPSILPAKTSGRSKLMARSLALATVAALALSAAVLWTSMPTSTVVEISPAEDPDRQVAVWVTSLGGTIQTNQDGIWLSASSPADFPAEPLRLTSIQLGGKQVTDADLARLRGATRLQMIWLGGAEITDAGLVHLSELTELRYLSLAQTAVSDAGLPLVSRLRGLRTLRLQGTQITDAGLSELIPLQELEFLGLADTKITDSGLLVLHRLPNVAELDVRGTEVTAGGVESLQKLLPNCKIRY